MTCRGQSSHKTVGPLHSGVLRRCDKTANQPTIGFGPACDGMQVRARLQIVRPTRKDSSDNRAEQLGGVEKVEKYCDCLPVRKTIAPCATLAPERVQRCPRASVRQLSSAAARLPRGLCAAGRNCANNLCHFFSGCHTDKGRRHLYIRYRAIRPTHTPTETRARNSRPPTTISCIATDR